MRLLFLVVFIYAILEFGLFACPVGSYQWIDEWGNSTCKSFENGNTTTIQGNADGCPTGSYPWVDNWGNSICKSFNGNQEYYDTSKGCPAGTYTWPDKWGNSTCKKF
ncbi:MAG: hypothetical protein J0L93_08270 [Deltaproteobacteria bacterium]|nr:hypothetical protein [Deltaproteobacteria bacterium]